MELIFSLIVAVLLYRIKLIDDRKLINFGRFKKYLQREGIVEEKNNVWEYEAWLDKDIRFELWEQYQKNKNDEGKKQAILDFYKDYKDNEDTRIFVFSLIVVNIVYLIVKNVYHADHCVNLYLSIYEIILIVFSIYACLKSPKNSLFNNRMLNPQNSKIIKKNFESIQKEIERDIQLILKKYGVR